MRTSRQGRITLPTIAEEDSDSDKCFAGLPQLSRELQELLADPSKLLRSAPDALTVAASLKHAHKREHAFMLDLLGNSLRMMAFSEHARVVVLAAIDVAMGSDRNRFVCVFQGHVLELSMSPHGHEVLMKMIESLPPYLLEFVAKEMTSQAATAAEHKYGCLALGAMLTYCPPSMTVEISKEIADKASHLAYQWQGKDVLQQLLEHGSADCRSLIVHHLMPQLPQLAVNRAASNVVKQALQFANDSEQHMMVHALLQASLGDIACSRGGSAVLKEIHRLGFYRSEVQLQLANAASRLSKCRFGRRIARYVGLLPSLGF